MRAPIRNVLSLPLRSGSLFPDFHHGSSNSDFIHQNQPRSAKSLDYLGAREGAPVNVNRGKNLFHISNRGVMDLLGTFNRGNASDGGVGDGLLMRDGYTM